jgi:methylthioribose-1-phosphate isomerase
MLTETAQRQGKDVWQGHLNGPAVILYGLFSAEELKRLAAHSSADFDILEGRPRLEIGQATSKQLLRIGKRPIVIADNMAGFLFYQKKVSAVYVTCQSRDDTGAFCPTGALILAVLCQRHNVLFHVVDAARDIDLRAKDQDLFNFQKTRVAARGIKAYVPLVEWIPSKYIVPNNG